MLPDTPLSDLKVLELGQLIAGPYCGQVLADFGAEVIKIEPPGKGDAMRQWGEADANGEPLWWNVIGRNKQSLTLNLKDADGIAILKKLIGEADILIENFRPDVKKRLRVDYEACRDVNPAIVSLYLKATDRILQE